MLNGVAVVQAIKLASTKTYRKFNAEKKTIGTEKKINKSYNVKPINRTLC